ncbi:hypothetical protein Bca52824_017020 [Brassica carinata]|uniref:Uncharacterized protein n=1 Tax=Brassica carinata TaxID=52824 RepID=A0A8X8AWZ5_BRACI|nr:hypothetical protein Bca52824_017020 [Brassica carinata]
MGSWKFKWCPCGARIINEVRGKDDSTLFTGSGSSPQNYEADGLHYRQPWVQSVEEELERLTKRVEEAEEVMLGSRISVSRWRDLRLDKHFKVNNLNEQVYDLTAQSIPSRRSA